MHVEPEQRRRAPRIRRRATGAFVRRSQRRPELRRADHTSYAPGGNASHRRGLLGHALTGMTNALALAMRVRFPVLALLTPLLAMMIHACGQLPGEGPDEC